MGWECGGREGERGGGLGQRAGEFLQWVLPLPRVNRKRAPVDRTLLHRDHRIGTQRKASVRRADASKEVGASRDDAETSATSPVLAEESDLLELQRVDELEPPCKVSLDGVRVDDVRRLVAAPHPDHVWSNSTAATRNQDWNHVSVEKAPVWLAVQEEDDRAVAISLVHVVHAHAPVHRDVARLIRPSRLGEVAKARLGSTHKCPSGGGGEDGGGSC